MSTLEDIDKAVNIFKRNECPFELMHCVLIHPMKIEDANLETINALKKDIIAKLAIVVMKVD